MRTINIELSFNETRRQYSEFVIYQLLETLNEGYNIDFYLITDKIDDISFIESFRKIFPTKLGKIYHRDIDEYLSTITFEKIPTDTTNYYGKMLLPRLYMWDMFPNLDRFINLEDDMLIRHSISDLWEFEPDAPLVAVQDYRQIQDIPHNEMKTNNLDKWFNAGVWVMNLKYFRENNMYEKLLKTVKEQNLLWLTDEKSFNIVYNQLVKVLPNDKWNYFDYKIRQPKDRDVYIYHWVSCSNERKPWNELTIFNDNPYTKEWQNRYDDYLRRFNLEDKEYSKSSLHFTYR